MRSLSGETIDWEGQDSGAREEKIYVSVRLRPLNERELAHNDVSDWECINDTTIIYKNSFHERSSSPTAYSFDRVFRTDCPTSQVYDDAAKKIVLSVLSGINSTIFAYGQTSSGKTFTMSGITEFAIEDMYNYIDKHRERDFILKFSAMEIYNEAVKDLINTDNTQLRLLDDPERGTVVDKLTEVTLRDSHHLRELLSVCESQRQTGETALNELSSRSHQILRLTVESEAREYFGVVNTSTLTASVNFVDLAGSERASQTNSAGTRLKEGCHINRSLLTLGTVIRKLSKGRNGHVPYRNSKLTRILQNSLGGNAKTAIICTMSPAHSHVEQSRNTLLFASCAKQVSTNAQVNVVMSEKALVKHLQKELARMENELRSLRGLRSLAKPGDSSSALKEKELLIEKMDKEIRELTHQRDLAHSRAENILHSGELHESKNWIYMNNLDKGSWGSEYTASESEIIDSLRSDTASCVSHYSDRYEHANSIKNEDPVLENNEEQFLADDTSPTLYIDKYFGPDPCRGWEKIGQEVDKNSEDNCKEVQYIETNEGNTVSAESSSDTEDASGQSPCSSDDLSDSNNKVPRSKSCAAILTTVAELELESPTAGVAKENETPFQEEAYEQGKISNVAPEENCETLCTKDTETSVKGEIENDVEENTNILGEESTENQQEAHVMELDEVIKPVTSNVDLESEDEKTSNTSEKLANDNFDKTQDMTQSALEKNAQDTDKAVDEDSDETHDTKATEEIAQDDHIDEAQYVKPSKENADETQSTKSSESEMLADDNLDKAVVTKQSASDWSVEFERQKREIIELWDTCHIPLVHRTYFFLLFNGDPSDAIYMEVELRRLSFLKNTLNGATSAKDAQLTRASSLKALSRETDMLSRQMLKKISTKEREALYEKWGIDLKSKQRRVQLCRQLWTDAKDTEHIKDSASVIAKLVGLKEPGQAPKEMVGLSFSERTSNIRSSWKNSLI